MSTRSVDDIKILGTILSVWAHPDDESFLAAGIMAAATSNGQPVFCVTATRGEQGIVDESKWPSRELGKIRSRELKTALDIIGCVNHKWLGYKDGECAGHDALEATNKLKAIIEQVSPDTILTFGPDGWTGHSDHATISKWVLAATKGTDIVVYHATHTPEHYNKYLQPADEKLNIFFNIDMPLLFPKEKCDIYFELPPEILDKKYRALEACTSQTSKMFEAFSEQFLRGAFSDEAFVRAN